MKVALLGRSQLLYAALEALSNAGHEIGLIVTAPSATEYSKKEEDFARWAKQHRCPFFSVTKWAELKSGDIPQDLDLAVSVNWPYILTAEAIGSFRLGILNAHAGDLPAYRGNACPNWAIIKGEEAITLSVHFMESGRLDCGRVIQQSRLPIASSTTVGEIYAWLEQTIPRDFVTAIATLEKDAQYQIKFADENGPTASRCYPRLPQDGFIDWRKDAVAIDRLIRATGRPFAGAYTYQLDKGKLKKLVIWESRVELVEFKDLAVPGHVLNNNKASGESLVSCGHGVIALKSCQYSDEQQCFSPGARWKSIRMRLGVQAEDMLWLILQQRDVLP